MSTHQGQVGPSQLLFGRNWEDPDSDRRALGIRPGDTVFAITSGGCNALGFLLEDPERVHVVDINECQSHLLELKMAAMRDLDHRDFLAFLGTHSAADRVATYRGLRGRLSSSAAAYWDAHPDLIQKGLLNAGRYERFVSVFRRLLHVVQGRNRIQGLFEQETLDDQARYFANRWDTRRFRSMLSLFFNKRILARRGLSADYFRFDDSDSSFAQSFYRRARHVMTALPTRENYFLALYLLGRYHSEQHAPEYLREDCFGVIRDRLDRVAIATADAKVWLESQPAGSINRFALSNICELMDRRDTDRTFEAVRHAAADGSTACFRNLMIPRTVPEHLSHAIVRDVELSAEILRNDRSFVYGRVDALRIKP